ncbi:DeoR/GlpR family DNA-binding transcription regulator [Eubacterium uniforme]|uniref:Transcriptional regulator, DeoR family n=1 Tax=Eubacterium uniforme TaxID=39495 RepID=A0A1T4VY36_9FIRM|nr:DeoR/GlpR family DNA-binding transcription regulator [Eubacterium uniforme]SKA69837.1 transcriptional regulator, DeoR family [Eubacterium uniforme]HAH17834.1 DeoR/GlpR transcriptional regulator [Eubacterium sp.]
MLATNRREKILQAINNSQGMTHAQLVELLGISESTIRRDIKFLHKEGKVLRVYGGAIPVSNDVTVTNSEISVKEKMKLNKEEKIRIAKYAATLINPGDFVFIDSGTTTGYMLGFIEEKNATYVTNSIGHARTLMKKGMKVVLLGGEIKEKTECLIGADAIVNLQKYHFTIGFFGANGIGVNSGFTTPDSAEAAVKRTAMEKTKTGRRYLLVDNDKFGKICNVTFWDGAGVIVLTEKDLDQAYKKAFKIQVVEEESEEEK